MTLKYIFVTVLVVLSVSVALHAGALSHFDRICFKNFEYMTDERFVKKLTEEIWGEAHASTDFRLEHERYYVGGIDEQISVSGPYWVGMDWLDPEADHGWDAVYHLEFKGPGRPPIRPTVSGIALVDRCGSMVYLIG